LQLAQATESLEHKITTANWPEKTAFSAARTRAATRARKARSGTRLSLAAIDQQTESDLNSDRQTAFAAASREFGQPPRRISGAASSLSNRSFDIYMIIIII
jgi:hypothetical protein